MDIIIQGLKFTTKGGPDSGHYGHAGRPGSVGGSAPGGWRAVPVEKPLTPAQRRAVDQEVGQISKQVARAMPEKGYDKVENIAKRAKLSVEQIASTLSLWELRGKVESRYSEAGFEYRWAQG